MIIETLAILAIRIIIIKIFKVVNPHRLSIVYFL